MDFKLSCTQGYICDEVEGKRNRNDEELWFSSGARTAAAHGYVRRVRGRCAAQLLELKSNLAFLLVVEVSRGAVCRRQLAG